MSVRALVVDDEAVARRRVSRLLAERDDVAVIGECSGGEAAVEAINRLQPDLVFLDVQMPDLDGFAVLRRIEPARLPAVVFVTAYDQYALRAFEACAIDYLLKPYEADRFAQAVDRAIQWIAKGTPSEQEERLKRLLREALQADRSASPEQASGGLAAPGGRIDRFMVKRGGKAQFVKAMDVDWLESDGNYVNLHVGKTSHLVRGTIAACAERLDPRQFVRIHRRYIVNVDRVKEVQPWFGGDYVILLEDGHKLRLSRNFREHFQSRMLGD
jgi:two-component system, LytTR family, response regulator